MPPITPAKPLNLPWHQSECYWLCVMPKRDEAVPELGKSALSLGFTEKNNGAYFQQKLPRQWGAAWQALFQELAQHGLPSRVDIALIAGEVEPEASLADLSRKTVSQVQEIASSLWLGEAVVNNRLMCYLQPVVSAPDVNYGYEAFARARTEGGSVVTGEAIVTASRALGVEYGIDRLLQVQAVKTFVASECGGFLFVNLFPGFIQRPEVYLEGLTEAVKSHGVVSRHVVLDFTKCETPHDMHHLRRVTEYCRERGYAIALDDIESPTKARELIDEIKPDYLKLDMKLVHRVNNSNDREDVTQIIAHCHRNGVSVIAEGVESKEMYSTLKSMNVDLYQGFLFSPPLPAEALQRTIKAAN